jgi:hypothetical protein
MKSNDELIERRRATAAAERKVIEAAKAQRRALRARPPLGSSDHNAVEWSRYVREAVDAYEAALDNLEAAERGE